MPELRIVLDPDQLGLGIEYEGQLIHLGDDAEIVITGLPDGMTSGKPSMAFAFKLPNGDLVVAETSWRLFATAYSAFLGKFGDPDLDGMEIKSDEHHIEFHASEKPFVQCGQCGWRLDGENTRASVEHLTREIVRHWRKKHPRLEMPPIPEFPGLN